MSSSLSHSSRVSVPRTNETRYSLREEEDRYELKLVLSDFAGRPLDQMELDIEGRDLTLSLPALTLPEGLQPLWEELTAESRVVRLRIPEDINLDQISATLNGEELMILLPKNTPTKRSVQIN